MPDKKVLIVDDAVLIRKLVSDALKEAPGVEVVGTAINGRVALEKMESLKPDIVIMDVEMPEMSGLEALKVIRSRDPHLPVVMFSSLMEHGSEATLEALELGATDYVLKPTGGSNLDDTRALIRSSLVSKITAFCEAAENRRTAAASHIGIPSKPVIKRPPTSDNPITLVAIGVSTGGPNALAQVMPSIPADFPVPIVIVQHMPPSFTKTLADRLNEKAAIEIVEAQEGELILPGKAYLAPGGYHMVFDRKGEQLIARMNQDPPVQACRPSVDVMYYSVAKLCGASTLAIILTGMGKDGLDGSRQILDAGGRLFAQDEETSVVWGMPGAVTRAGLPEKVIPLDLIAYEIVRNVEKSAVAI